MRAVLCNLSIFFLVLVGSASASAQQIQESQVNSWLTNAVFDLIAIQEGQARLLAHSLEFTNQLYWVGAEGLADATYVGQFNATAFIYVNEGSRLFLNLMIPSNMSGMNVRIDHVDEDALHGELILPEFLFYDPANPPELPPPTTIRLQKAQSRLMAMPSIESVHGRWEVTEVQDCDLDPGMVFRLAPDGEGGVVSEQEEEYMAWTISPSRTVLFMDSYAESLSESVAGHFLDTETLHAVSSLQGCRLTMKKLG